MRSFLTGSRVYGTPREYSDVDLVVLLDAFDGGLSVRWKSGGGDSVVRFRNAVESLKEWERIAQRCTFVCMDAFAMLDEVKTDGRDIAESALYIDAPWVKKGLKYSKSFTEQQHRELAKSLLEFEKIKIVVRYGDHPLVRELYSEQDWEWRGMNGRTQTNNDSNEVLIVRRR